MSVDVGIVQAVSDFHYTGGPFNGYEYAGYIGSSERNYVTDSWVEEGAAALGWTPWELSTWMLSRWGRWALDSEPMSAAEMLEQMRSAPIDELMTAALYEAEP